MMIYWFSSNNEFSKEYEVSSNILLDCAFVSNTVNIMSTWKLVSNQLLQIMQLSVSLNFSLNFK